jgi:hypothetical protein
MYRRDDRGKKKPKKEVRLCSYCCLNRARASSSFCCDACATHGREYEEWLAATQSAKRGAA